MSEPELLKFVKQQKEEHKNKFNGSEKEKEKKYLEFILVLIDVCGEVAKDKDHSLNGELIKDMVRFYLQENGPMGEYVNKTTIKKWFKTHLPSIYFDSFKFDPSLFDPITGGRKGKRSIKRKNKRRKTQKNKI
jgi:hypothetical protein